MILSRIASKRNTLWALLALSVMVVLCWGEQAGAVQQSPLSAEQADSQPLTVEPGPMESVELPAERLGSTLDSPTASEPLDDCDQAEQLVQAQTFSADSVLPTCLLLMWLIAGWLRRTVPPRRPFDPIGSPKRRHLVFCVFRE